MRRSLILMAALGALAACAQAPRPESAPAAAPTIEVSNHYFGRTVGRWLIAPSGEGFFRPDPGGPPGEAPASARRVAAGAEGYRQVRAVLEPLKARIGERPRCRESYHDAPSASVRWTTANRAETFGVAYGCVSSLSEDAGRRIAEATRLVAGWAAAGEVVEEPPAT